MAYDLTPTSLRKLKPPRAGRIHMRCRGCGFTRSNMKRADYDPANAVAIVMNYCPHCDKGGDFEETWYYDAACREIDIGA